MAYEFIDYDIEDHVAVITMHRPERLNALHGPLLEELLSAVQDVRGNDDVRVFLLTGGPRTDGRPCFSAGVDLKAASEGIKLDGRVGPDLTNMIDDLLKPSIAVVDGVCSTGAVELALSCDFRIVGETAQISDWHLKNLGTGLGGWGASTRWTRLVGVAKTKEIILTGKVVDGQEAYRIGFATAVHSSDRLMAEAKTMAKTIAGMSPEGVRLTLAHLDKTADMSRDQSLRWAEILPQWFNMRGSFEDRARSFLDKRSSGDA